MPLQALFTSKGFHFTLHPEQNLSVSYMLYNIIYPFSLCLSFRQGAGKQKPVDQGRERAECHREPDQLYDGKRPDWGGIFPRPDFRHPLAITKYLHGNGTTSPYGITHFDTWLGQSIV